MTSPPTLSASTEHSTLVQSIEAALLDALPPLYRKVRPKVMSALAFRLARPWRPKVKVCAASLLPALRECVRTLEDEVAELIEESTRFARAWSEAKDEAEQREVLLQHIRDTVPVRSEQRKDLKALKRWLSFDALRERQEARRQRLLVQEEMAFRAVAGLVASGSTEDRARLEAELPASATQLLDRALQSPRLQNQLAALEALAKVLQTWPAALARTPEAAIRLGALVDRDDTSPWVQAAALEALLAGDHAAGIVALRQRIRTPQKSGRDFLFRRQAFENAAAQLSAKELLLLLTEAAHSDPSEYVRIGVAELLAGIDGRTPLLRRLAGLDPTSPEPSARVRAAAVLTAAAVAKLRKPGWEEALSLIADGLTQDREALVLRVACDQISLLADGLSEELAQSARARLSSALKALRARDDIKGAVLESASAAQLAVTRAADPTRRAWSRYLYDLARTRPMGTKVRVTVEPPPPGLPALPKDEIWLGGLLADLAQDDYGYYAERDGNALNVWRGDVLERRSWRVLHEATRPAPNKRQGFMHTVGRKGLGNLRAHPAHMDEITATTVPGERVHVASEGTWGRHVPTVDDLLDLPLFTQKPVQLFSSHGVTTLTPPPSLSRRIKNRLKLTKSYDHFHSLRQSSLGGKEARERRRYVESVQNELGVEMRFTPYDSTEAAPSPIGTLFGLAARRANAGLEKPPSDTVLHAAGLAEATWLATLSDVLMERNDYFFGTRGNGILALAVFTAGLFTYFLCDAYRKREEVRTSRMQIPLCVGGWGTRGKSGTERLKAALFNGLGFEVFAKTTGSEAMFVHSAPGGTPHEFFIYRPYDKATIWEQKDMVSLGARMGVEVFLWECMALQPSFVELLQNDWMHDDIATLTNAYPDHEDIQGPTGQNVAQVITHFMPEGGRVVTTEDHFLPLFQEASKSKETDLIHSPWWEAELIPEELLEQFPYREHPRNMALVATMAEELGVPRTKALGMMAEFVQPEIGVLKVFPRVQVRGRNITFINGHSANERTGFLNNWVRTGLDKVDPNVDGDRAVVTVINNRWDRVARSEVFARIMVEDAAADKHVLIGTNIEGLTRYVSGALDAHLAQREIVSAEDLAAGEEGHQRAQSRLGRELATVKVPVPTVATFLDRAARFAKGANLQLGISDGLEALVGNALSGEGTELRVDYVRTELAGAFHAVIDECLVAGTTEHDAWLPETLEPATKDQVKEHALYLLARMAVHARLRARLPGGSNATAPKLRIDAFHQEFRAAYRGLFMETLVPVGDPTVTGDQIVDVCAKSVGPGLEVSVMGAQNIKGTGLDWVYRWMAVDKVTAALKAVESGGVEEQRRGLETLETFSDHGFVDAGLAESVLPQLIEDATSEQQAERLRQVHARLSATHAEKVQSLVAHKSGTRVDRALRSLEKTFDYLDSVRRRKIADHLADDLVNMRISHARAAIETRKLYERQKGGWLFAGLRAKKPQPVLTAGAAKTPPPLPKTPRTAFDRALRAQHDARVPVPTEPESKSPHDAKTEANPVEPAGDADRHN